MRERKFLLEHCKRPPEQRPGCMAAISINACILKAFTHWCMWGKYCHLLITSSGFWHDFQAFNVLNSLCFGWFKYWQVKYAMFSNFNIIQTFQNNQDKTKTIANSHFSSVIACTTHEFVQCYSATTYNSLSNAVYKPGRLHTDLKNGSEIFKGVGLTFANT